MNDSFPHLGRDGAARMVDVADKKVTARLARAEGLIRMAPATLRGIVDGVHAKGDVLGVARVAAVMAAKRAAELVPLCHPIALTGVTVDFAPLVEESALRCTASVTTRERTGVEMEALAAVQVALLTVYDMCKSADRGMVMDGIALVEKRGGRSGRWTRHG